MKVLITGGSGFIGSHFAELCVKNDLKVTIVDNFSTGNLNNLVQISNLVNLVNGDIRDKGLVDELISEAQIIFHFAAALGVRKIMENPLESISINYHGSEVVLNSAASFGKRILIASTSEIYGKNPNQPLNEESDRVIGKPQNIRWTYSDAKALEEAHAEILYQKNNLPVTTIRFFNTVGPRQTSQYGMVIPRLIESALKNEPMIIFGNGNQSRVFCHVSDAISAVYKLAFIKESIGKVYNVGGYEEITINELAKLIKYKTNSNSIIKYVEYDNVYGPGFEDMFRRVPDITKVTKEINWSPLFGVEKIVEDILSFY